MTAEEINALPDRVRSYIHDLETRADPAGDVRELFRLREENASLRTEVEARSICAGCGTPLQNYCPACQKLWES